jgi:hypothetical protein
MRLYITLMLLCASQVAASEDDNIKEMLEIMYPKDMYAQLIGAYIKDGKKSYPEYGDKYWELTAKYYSYNVVIDRAIPMYRGVFTESELTQLVVFLKSDAGKVLITKMPKIYERWSTVNREFSREVQEKVRRELRGE